MENQDSMVFVVLAMVMYEIGLFKRGMMGNDGIWECPEAHKSYIHCIFWTSLAARSSRKHNEGMIELERA